jgi:hypothetical protein
MKQMIKIWCSHCPVCQQAKVERVKYPGLLQPLPIRDGAWKMITMDFIEGSPTSDRCKQPVRRQHSLTDKTIHRGGWVDVDPMHYQVGNE